MLKMEYGENNNCMILVLDNFKNRNINTKNISGTEYKNKEYITRLKYGGKQDILRIKHRHLIEKDKLNEGCTIKDRIDECFVVKINSKEIWDKINNCTMSVTKEDFKEYVEKGKIEILEEGVCLVSYIAEYTLLKVK